MVLRAARGGIALVAVVAMAGSMGFACGAKSPGSFLNPDGGKGHDGGLGGDSTVLGDGSMSFTGDASSEGSTAALTIEPQNPTLAVTVPGPAATVSFQALPTGSSTPVPATWLIDNPQLGTIDGSGNFVASGVVSGTTKVTAQTGTAMATTTLSVTLSLSENPGSLTPAQQAQLQAGGTGDSAFAWLYPYDKTVFPRGLTAPILQFAGTAPDAVYVKATSASLTYEGFFGSSSPPGGGGQVTLSAATWNTIVTSVGAMDPLTVTLTKLSGGQASGPITETWKIAQGSLSGTVYYNSYDSMLAGGVSAQSGAVLKMRPGTPASLLAGGGSSSNCVVCHAVSANGSVLVADGPAGDPAAYAVGASYTLASNADGGSAATATLQHNESDSQFGFGGLYPDGSLILSCASMAGGWSSNGPNIPGLGDIGMPSGDRPSVLMNPATGTVVPAPGFDGVVTHALMPAFSPDGKWVAFNHYDAGMGHSLSVMQFAKASTTFSALVDVATDPTYYLAWPAFLPDSSGIIYNTVNYGDYATWADGTGASRTGDLQWTDIASKTVTPLDAANGIANGAVYLPYGAAEAHLNFEPTVLPVAVGGYYWIVFTSRREYGNTLNTASGDGDAFETSPAKRKKLWVAAVDIGGKAGTDPSHPALYINDQELQAGNSRGFWALDPCQQNGTSCNSGDQCCAGFCRQDSVDGGAQLTCVPPPMGCAQANEKCTTTADCCGAAQGYECINGFCAMPTPQ
jgi:hypothetical protein